MAIKESVTQDGHQEEEGISEQLTHRILRGVNLYAERGAEIVWLADDRCYVPSRTRPGKRYVVVFGEDGERCKCRDFEIHGAENGCCLHTVAALISWSKRVFYEVRRDRDLNYEADVYKLVEVRGGAEQVLYQSDRVSEVYWHKWQLERPEWDVDEMLAATRTDIEAGVA